MSAGTFKRSILKPALLACAVTVLGAGYAVDATNRFRGVVENPGDVIAAFQNPAFLAYVKRRQMQSDPQLMSVSVGNILPDSGVRYYGIPLCNGSPLYRSAIIGEEVVIADPSTGRVVQVVD